MELGDYINQYLLEHNLSYRQFAKMTGISHTYIANIVNGKTGRGTKPVLTLLKLKQLADGMGIDFTDFLSEIDVDVDLRESKPSLSDIGQNEQKTDKAIVKNCQKRKEKKPYFKGFFPFCRLLVRLTGFEVITHFAKRYHFIGVSGTLVGLSLAI